MRAGEGDPPAAAVDVPAWRGSMRRRLLAARVAVPLSHRRRQDLRITDMLLFGFHPLAGLSIGFYWPKQGEFDPRPAVLRWRERGSPLALPVVVRKAALLRFLEWWPGIETRPGIFDLPIPQGSRAIVPDVVLMPPVGFDERGYRLGYGGAYFDRTLARRAPQPLKIGVAREVSRVETILPQAHDVRMDFVVTEQGIYEAAPSGLRLVERIEDAARLVQAALLRRRTMSRTELGELLNTLLECERAGAKALAGFMETPLPVPVLQVLADVQRDESRNCAVLLRLLRRTGVAPSRATGAFLQKALALQGLRARLEFLNRGQAWVARRLAEALPRIGDVQAHHALQAMHDSHVANIEACEALLSP